MLKLTSFLLLIISLSYPPGAWCQSSLVGVKDFILSDDAVRIGDQCVRLTNPVPWSGGSAWYRDPIDLGSSFHMELELMFGCDDEGGADGMVFVFTPYQGVTGYQGEGMGFAGLKPSLGIEIDTWENEHLADPPQDHIALLQHGYVHHYYNLYGPVVIPNVEDCLLHKLMIEWDHPAKKLSIILDGKNVLQYQDDLVNNIFMGESKLYWGITAATGRYFNRQEICFRKLEFSTPLTDIQFHPRESKILLNGLIHPFELEFDRGKPQWTLVTEGELIKLVHLLKQYPNHEVDVDIHVKELAGSPENLLLARLRKQSIEDYFISKGIDKKRLHIRALGDAYPPDKLTQPYQNDSRIAIRIYNPRT